MSRGNFGAKPRRQPSRDHSLTPADLSLEQYREVAPRVVDDLVAEFGEAAALRLLNGKPAPSSEVPPFDSALLAPPGAAGNPHGHRSKGQARLIETGGWT